MIKPKNHLWLFGILTILLFVSFIFSLSLGDSGADFSDVLRVFSGKASQQVYQIIMRIRLPRILAYMVAGGSLALSGSLLQTLTRNPLADSGILGINAGAGLVVAIVIAYFSLESRWMIRLMPMLAMLGGCLVIVIVYHIAKKGDQGLSPVRLIITGVGLSSMISGTMVSIVGNVNPYKVEAIVNWLSGRGTGGNWRTVTVMVPLLIVLWCLTYYFSHKLNVLSLHEQTALALGLDVPKERLRVLVLATGLAALSVVLVGNVTFVGLVSGHVSRRLIGANHRLSLPASLMFGMLLLLVADSIGRILLVGTGIPTGLIVASLGAPYFLYLMAQLRS
ncbi:FecCD family ABC transporter permease [Streptococcus ovuberis]|uniref:Iron ABC transporter permease n=1 Tax=Streptococcus ovuberis TaxID=1936207 RepID=A0A7X6S218_9STRE|nr:iron ABC transporter permease [Streptococcus ovuberis]NKZ20776.1 iron ABC transporter permease [Streptococcus ovuberis]